jgi:alpha-1,3-rhamnosyl/mannosyltransferase
MRVAFNATALLSPMTGIGQYAHQLAKGLQQHADIDLDLFYASSWRKELRSEPVPNIVGLKSLVRRFLPSSYHLSRMIQQRFFTAGTRQAMNDIYHEPNFLAFRFDGPSVITVHDLSWIRHPEMHPVDRVRAMDKYFQPGLERASLILTDSEFVKQELIDVFRIKPERIKPVLLGVEALFKPQSSAETLALLNQHQLVHGQYLLAVGTLEPRKNLQLALRAFMQLPANFRKTYPLVLVGMKGWHTSALEQEIAPLLRAGQVRQLGYLPRVDLASIIAGATTLIYPSVYEGFGLPPLEAMACGVPVIVSNASSLPEVVGDTGLLIDPHDADGLASAIQTLVDAPGLRQLLAQKALQRSATFTWSRCVDQTLDGYRAVLNNADALSSQGA